MHSQKVMDQFHNPRKAGSVEHPNAVGQAGNPADRETIRLYSRIQNDTVVHAKVKVFGCPTAIAAASVLTELIIGKSVDQALALRNEDVSAALGGVPEGNMRCSVLAEAVLEDGIAQYRHEAT